MACLIIHGCCERPAARRGDLLLPSKRISAWSAPACRACRRRSRRHGSGGASSSWTPRRRSAGRRSAPSSAPSSGSTRTASGRTRSRTGSPTTSSRISRPKARCTGGSRPPARSRSSTTRCAWAAGSSAGSQEAGVRSIVGAVLTDVAVADGRVQHIELATRFGSVRVAAQRLRGRVRRRDAQLRSGVRGARARRAGLRLAQLRHRELRRRRRGDDGDRRRARAAGRQGRRLRPGAARRLPDALPRQEPDAGQRDALRDAARPDGHRPDGARRPGPGRSGAGVPARRVSRRSSRTPRFAPTARRASGRRAGSSAATS